LLENGNLGMNKV